MEASSTIGGTRRLEDADGDDRGWRNGAQGLSVSADAPIHLVVGDITQIPADAIVNAANSRLAGGSGVDGAIHRAGGPEIMNDLYLRYGRDRHCPTGQAVITGAGNLPARWVIHAV